MLTYSIRLGNENIKMDKIVWSEKFVAPDLSFVSGVTSIDYHIDKDKYISASIGSNTNFSRLSVTSENVTRNGYIVIKNKEYKIKGGKKSTVSGGSFSYVDINGVYYYVTGSSITVKNWLQEKWTKVNGEYKVDVVEGDAVGKCYTVDRETFVRLDTIVWIENETVTIDGNTYIFDQYDKSEFSNSPGGIKYYETGRSLTPKEITGCETIYFNHFKSASEYKYVTKFILRKTDDELLDYDRMSYCTYFYYVFYNGYYCPVKKVNDSYKCYVPDVDQPYDVTMRNGESAPTRISQLKDFDAYVTIDGTQFDVEYMVQNANSGDEIAIYLTDSTHNLSVGDKLTLSCDNNGTIPVYSANTTTSNPTEYYFVWYDNVKHLVEKDIADVVKIDGVEYDIEYPNGKTIGKDALVDVDGEKIPMKIKSSSKLERYGLIVSGVSSITEAVYDIVSYSGVTINGKTYRVENDDSTTPRTKYIVTDEQLSSEFKIISIEGSSLLICEPNLNKVEYDDTFRDQISSYICDYYLSRSEHVRVLSKNRAFGSRIITPEIGFANNNNVTSSNDYYDLFDNLVLFTNSNYVQMDIPLKMNVANNIMQEDIVKRDFYDAEKNKAINPIVDMEKDVYTPMYMDGVYSGSTTDFFPITEIEVNLHFRTRNLDNWKVNEGYNNMEVSGVSDNWFCTDFYPYKQLLASTEKTSESNGSIDANTVIMNSSDLIGLLYFDNDDVFYQKSNISKSFLRFSYYDSPDPNTQSLLCTSTVFVDEHLLYKKYIDNSRRNVHDFGIVDEQEYKRDSKGNMVIPQAVVEDFSGSVINRISVSTEVLKSTRKTRRNGYNYADIDLDELYANTKRISSRFTINSKYETTTSSEGFYLYIFREYSENLHPKPIYMKIEFNHAGIGRTIPFIVPMMWSGSTDNEMLPASALTLSGSDLEYLKNGYPLSYVYAQTYIPLYAVYDFKHKQYAYVFDNRYIDEKTLKKENKVKLNLFEIKVMDENTTKTSERAQVRNNNISRANIDVNKKQFDEDI